MKKLLAVAVATFSLAPFAQAASFLVDTGSPELTQNGGVSVCGNFLQEPGGYGKGCAQSVALQFTLNGSAKITSADGYLWSGIAPGTLTLALYSDANGLPGAELFSQQFGVPFTGSGSAANWFGVSGVNWDVAQGKYWAAFEVRSGQSFYGALEIPAPTRLPAVVKNDYFTVWNIGGTGGGLRVAGEYVSAVPTPAGMSMMLAGLALVGAAARRRKTPAVQA